MKALVSFQPNKKLDNFEGSRLRKTIKGALELVNIAHTSNDVGEYDILHLLTYNDYNKINEAHAKNIPVVVSALMCEGDSEASFLDFKFNDGKVSYTLPSKALKFLNKADYVIVPCDNAAKFLRDNGVVTPIRAMVPGVNLSRFDFTREDEKELFFKYFREDPTKKLVISLGDINYLEGLNAFVESSLKCPDAIFYFFVNSKGSLNKSKALKKIIKRAPKNLHFVELAPSDIYRSAVINASVFMYPCYHQVGVISLLEAMAAKCEIVIREQEVFPSFIKEGETAHVAKFSETLSSLVRDCLDGKAKSTAANAYEAVSNYTLEAAGAGYKYVYQRAIKIRN